MRSFVKKVAGTGAPGVIPSDANLPEGSSNVPPGLFGQACFRFEIRFGQQSHVLSLKKKKKLLRRKGPHCQAVKT